MLWTDAFQMTILFCVLLVLLIKGSADAGGISEVWRVADRGGRLDVTKRVSP